MLPGRHPFAISAAWTLAANHRSGGQHRRGMLALDLYDSEPAQGHPVDRHGSVEDRPPSRLSWRGNTVYCEDVDITVGLTVGR